MMDFEQQLQIWEKGELLQGRVMIAIGLLLLVAFIAIVRSGSELFRGMIFPLSLLLAVLLLYGGYILYSRPAHAKDAIALFQRDRNEGIKQELQKHESDNKVGNAGLRIYPLILLVSALGLILARTPFYKGMALGFALLAISIFIIDSGFVSRSNVVIEFFKNQ